MKKDELTTYTPVDAKSMLCDVAVLSAYQIDFNLWVKENHKENERYHCISRMEDIWGKVFHRVEKTPRWLQMPNFLKVKKSCLEHCL